MEIALCAIGLLASIWISYRRKLNIGVLAAAAAYGIGCFYMKLPVRELIGMISVNTLFSIIGITFFYGIAIENGTMELLTYKILYRMRNHAALLPLALLSMAFLISGAGLGAGPTVALTGPLAMQISSMGGVSLLVAILAISVGASCGSNLPWSQGGVVIEDILETLEGSNAAGCMNTAILHTLAANLIALFLVILILGRKKLRPLELHESRRFDSRQVKSLALMAVVVFFMVVPKLAVSWLGPGGLLPGRAVPGGTLPSGVMPGGALPSGVMPGGTLPGGAIPGGTLLPGGTIPGGILPGWLVQMAEYCDVGFISLLGAAVASAANLADQKAVIQKRIPWNVIMMIGGISIMTGVLKEAGAVEALARFITATIPRVLIPAALCLGAAVMSLFSGATTVVVPTLFTVVPGIAAGFPSETGLFYAAVLLGACMGGICPFSNGGSMLLGSCEDPEVRDRLAYHMLILLGFTVTVSVLYMLIIQFFY